MLVFVKEKTRLCCAGRLETSIRIYDINHRSLCATALEDKLDLTLELCHFACYLLSRLHGVLLIRETKSKAVKPIVAATPETRRRIPSLEGASDPFGFVTDELQLVEENLLRAIRSREQTLTDIAAHLICGGGKRVRPMVTLLAFLAFGGKRTQDIVDIATAIELIHTATLLHDDIIDRADTRRGAIFFSSKRLSSPENSMRPLSNGQRMPVRF